MYARVTMFKVQSGAMDQVAGVWKELTQGSEEDKGLRGGWLLYDPTSDKGISISHWERQEDIAAFEAGDLYKQQLAKIAGFLAERPTTEIYQVRDQV